MPPKRLSKGAGSARSSRSSPLQVAAKAALGAPAGVRSPDAKASVAAAKVDGAGAAANSTSHAKATLSEREADSGPLYTGSILDVVDAQKFVSAMSLADMSSLADSTATDEQLPPRMMLEFVGDKDTSWSNAQKSLRDGAAFKKEVLEMEGASYITKKSVERFEALGALQPASLRSKNPASFAMAVFLEAVIDAAKDKLDMKPKAPPAPEPTEEPPSWPIVVDFKQIGQAMSDALKWRRTPLFICNGKAQTVDTFFSYQACSLIDAKWILNSVSVKKELSVPQMQERLRERLVSALKFGQPIHISMSNSAVPLRERYCAPDLFPESVFKMDVWFQRDEYSKVVRDSDLADWPGAFPGRMKDDSASYAFVTSDFNLENAREYLPAVLPYFSDMAIIEVNPASIHADA